MINQNSRTISTFKLILTTKPAKTPAQNHDYPSLNYNQNLLDQNSLVFVCNKMLCT